MQPRLDPLGYNYMSTGQLLWLTMTWSQTGELSIVPGWPSLALKMGLVKSSCKLAARNLQSQG